MSADLFFDYDLPPDRVAQRPAVERDASRLLVLDRRTDSLAHHTFADLPGLLDPGDLVVVNETKVTPARLLGTRTRTGGWFEALVLNEAPGGAWEALAQTRGFVEDGETLRTDSGLALTLEGRTPERRWLLRPHAPGAMLELLAAHGHPPLPPYIRKGRPDPTDADRYQTVYARSPGSVAAPTAGLHFTPGVFAALAARDISVAAVTLHVGLGTFAPVKCADPRDHTMHAEWCDVPADTLARCRATRTAGKRVVAVGTTTTRALETAAVAGESFRGPADLFIRPPYPFRVVNSLVTNFHLPRTTLLLLVQALAGVELTRRAYAEAVAGGYRFFSYGDAMLVI